MAALLKKGVCAACKANCRNTSGAPAIDDTYEDDSTLPVAMGGWCGHDNGRVTTSVAKKVAAFLLARPAVMHLDGLINKKDPLQVAYLFDHLINQRAPVQVEVTGLGDGHLEPAPQLRHDRSDDRALLFQRVHVPEQDVELDRTHIHRLLRRS